jgi:hypothetical protein
MYLLPSREQVPLERLPLDKLSQLMEPLGYGLHKLTFVHKTLRDFESNILEWPLIITLPPTPNLTLRVHHVIAVLDFVFLIRVSIPRKQK